jgi:hypothetical protein
MGGMQPPPAQAAPAFRLAKPDGVNAAVWIVAILAGFLAFNALGLMAGGALTEKMQELQSQMTARLPPQAPAADLERMMATQREIIAASRPDFALPVGVLSLLVAAAAIVYAVRLNKRRRDAVVWFSRVTIAIAVLELIGMIQGLQVQRRIQPLMAEMMNSMPQGRHPEQIAPFMKMMNGMMSGMSVMALVFTVVWALAKIGGCLYARHCAYKPVVRDWMNAGP